MTEQFDPYYRWLGIRPQEQPPNHYQLLGLRQFEDNPETIQHAADRQTAHLRTMRTGEHATLSQKLLAEVAAARSCLLTPDKKAAYDTLLQGEAQEAAFDDSFITESWLHTTPLTRPKKQQPKRPSRQVAIIGGLCAVTLLVAGVLWFGHESSTKTPLPVAKENAPVLPRQSVKPSTAPKQPAATTQAPSEKRDTPPSHPSGPSSQPVVAAAPINKVARATAAKKTVPPKVAQAASATKRPNSPPAGNVKTVSKPVKLQERLPVPSLAVQNEIGKQVNDLCKDAKTSAEKVKVAKQLMSLAEATQKPEERFVIRRRVAELASDAGQLPLMRQAIESIATEFKIDSLMVEAKMFDRQAAIERADELLRRAVIEDRFDVALNVVGSANRMCQKSSAARFRKEVRQRQVEVDRLRERWLEASVAMKTLEATPDDPLANLTVGRWLWFQKGEVRRGLSYLAKGSDELLKRLAQRDLTEQPTESDPQIKLADAWWELAQTRSNDERDCLMLRAAEWYEEVNPTLSGGLTKVRVEKRLEEVAVLKRSLAKSLIPPPVGACLKQGDALPSGRWTDLLALVDVKRDSTGGQWERNGSVFVAKQAKNSALLLPVAAEGDYDLEVQFTRTVGHDTVAMVFLVGSNPCLLTFSEASGRASRLAINPNLSPPQQDNRIRIEPSVLTNGQKYAVLVTVRLRGDEASIQVCLDGKPHLSWSGKQKAVSLAGWPALPAKRMALGTHEAVTFHSVRLRPISGKATLIVPPGKG